MNGLAVFRSLVRPPVLVSSDDSDPAFRQNVKALGWQIVELDHLDDWAQIVVLYGLLERRTDNPVVTLNRAVAVGMAQGPRAGLAVLDTVADDPRLRRSHRPDAVRACTDGSSNKA